MTVRAGSAQTAPASAGPVDAALLDDLVAANRILVDQGVVDGYGHVSVRHPADLQRYLMSRSIAPELVTAADIMEYDLDSSAVDARGRTSYLERFIHGEIYRARPDVKAVVHNHSPSVIPFGVSTVRRSFPQTSGTIDVPGLSHEVTVVRDSYGVPQIYADTPRDLFFAQGYVQAQDRFFEMDVRRHITSGRLSELFGKDTLETDEVVLGPPGERGDPGQASGPPDPPAQGDAQGRYQQRAYHQRVEQHAERDDDAHLERERHRQHGEYPEGGREHQTGRRRSPRHRRHHHRAPRQSLQYVGHAPAYVP